MPESSREQVDTASAIKSILDGYPWGNGVLREFLQNSDDAKATKQIFILDTRQHGTESLLDPVLAGTQGPALLCINDTTFSPNDWKALKTIHGSSKSADETKTGKYGLGFRSCYHITDNPHILSEETLQLFDPHNEFRSPYDGGMSINITREGAMYRHQLAAFSAAAVDVEKGYPGTIVRLPLRTAAQAQRNRIKRAPMSANEIGTLFYDFLKKEMSTVLLFLKHVASIELRIVTKAEEKVIGKVSIEDAPSLASRRAFARGSSDVVETFKLTVTVRNELERTSARRTWRILHSVRNARATADIMSRRLGFDIKDRLVSDKLSSHVALALPVDGDHLENLDGRLFTLLPLPINTGFPLHLHAILALTSTRQALRNMHEVGVGHEDRERLLVEWNYAIFEDFIPSAWAKLLAVLIKEDKLADIWSAFPPSIPSDLGQELYWGRILGFIISELLSARSPVWPTVYTSSSISSYVDLDTALVASPVADTDVLAALARAGVSLVQPPERVFNILEDPKFSVKFLSAESAYRALLQQSNSLRTLSLSDQGVILEYLCLAGSGGHLHNIVGLPLIPLADGSFTSLSKRTATDQVDYVLVSDVEKDLFESPSTSSSMVMLSQLPTRVSSLFCEQATAKTLNLSLLGVSHVKSYIHRLLGHLHPALDYVELSDAPVKVDWLVRFWAWADIWSHSITLISSIQGFHLLPTSVKTLCKVASRIVTTDQLDKDIIAVLARLQIQFLHPRVAVSGSHVLVSQKVVLPNNDVDFVLDRIQYPPSREFDSNDSLALQRYFVTCLQTSSLQTSKLVLTERRKQIFAALPIFPIFEPQVTRLNAVVLRPAVGTLIFIGPGIDVFPIIGGTSYVDVSKGTRVLSLLLDRRAVSRSMNELGVLGQAIDHLASQPPWLARHLIERIIRRLSDLPPQSLQTLRATPFVVVGNGDKIKPPNEVVDPESPLAKLFTSRDNRLPTGRFSNPDFLSLVRPFNLFQSRLTPELALERIQYLSRTDSESHGSTNAAMYHVAKTLLDLLDETYVKEDASMNFLRAHSWLPTREGKLSSADCCRDHDSKESYYLFDLTLSVVDRKLQSEVLRSALGWTTPLPFKVLQSQLRTIMDSGPEQHSRRLMYLIKYFSVRFHARDISADDVQVLQAITGRKNWIPLSEVDLIATRHAIFGKLTLEPFKTLPSSLHDPKCRRFLAEMGCLERPALATLLDELGSLDTTSPSRSAISASRRLLEEIASQFPDGLLEEDQKRLLIPTCDMHLCPIEDVYYPDSTSGSIALSHYGSPVHRDISPALADLLGIRRLTSLELGDDNSDEEDDEDMGEDLTVRINGVLKDYNISSALNEFVANAADAGADDFTIVLDERSFPCLTVLSPEIGKIHGGPAILLHNNAIFTENDFRGLRKIGEGSKIPGSGSIGRFGLGALSLFHFSEFPMLISGDYVLFLDPSESYLPRLRGKKRRSLKRPLATFARQYPDQIAPLHGLFGFNSTSTHYEGTLFRLPLGAQTGKLSGIRLAVAACAELINGPFYTSATQSLFFTTLKSLSAVQLAHSELSDSGAVLWSVSARRLKQSSKEQDEMQRIFSSHEVELRLVGPKSPDVTWDKWLIAESIATFDMIPDDHLFVLDKYRLWDSNSPNARSACKLRVGLSFQLHSAEVDEKYHIFSSLPMPMQTSLPVHVNGQFILAPDRRSLRFDPPDDSGHRVPEAAFNFWMLSQNIPYLYLYGLEILGKLRLRTDRDNSRWWPAAADDEISRCIVDSFYRMAADTPRSISRTVTGRLISPPQAVFSDIEPELITDVLRDLKAENLVCSTSRIRRLLKAKGTALATVNGAYLGSELRQKSIRIRELFPKTVRIQHINAIIDFLAEGRIPLSGLPLLVLEDGSLHDIAFDAANPTYTSDVSFTDVFPSHSFISKDFTPASIRILTSEAKYGIRELDKSGVAVLVGQRLSPAPQQMLSSELSTWVDLFWSRSADMPPNSTAEIQAFPLVPVRHYNYTHVSLDHCSTGEVMAWPEYSLIGHILEKMGATLVRKNTETLRVALKHVDFTFDTLLKWWTEHLAFASSLFLVLARVEQDQLSQWIRSHINQFIEAPSAHSLVNIPIWVSWTVGGGNALGTAGTLSMLPAGMTARSLLKYLAQGSLVAEFSLELSVVLAKSNRNHKLLNYTEMLSLLTFPETCMATELGYFKSFLSQILSLGRDLTPNSNVKVLNGNLQFVHPSILFDSSIPCFEAAFRAMQETAFLHPELFGMRSQLHSMGLRHQIDFSSFHACALAMDREMKERITCTEEQIERARIVYACYKNDLPSRIMTNSTQWHQLDKLRFIPRQPSRRHIPFFKASNYCNFFPGIIAANELLREGFESVAWTQRALFAEQPSEQLIAVNPGLGRPTIPDVVSHLVALSLIMRGSPRQALVNDLRDTYTWLNSHPDEARLLLLQHDHEALFLNVDDPSTNVWCWRSARELVLNLHYDGHELVAVRGFLGDFKKLLLAAGANALVDPKLNFEHGGAPTGDTLVQLRFTFNELRQQGHMTDIVLVPTETDGWMGDREIDLKAHRVYLAAAIPHMKTALVEGWRESSSFSADGLLNYTFYGTAFGASAILDFVYTGDITIERPQNPDDAMHVLRELLELLPIADSWEMHSLKGRLCLLIVKDLELMIPETHTMILHAAREHNAQPLIRYCEEYQSNNQQILKALEKEDD